MGPARSRNRQVRDALRTSNGWRFAATRHFTARESGHAGHEAAQSIQYASELSSVLMSMTLAKQV